LVVVPRMSEHTRAPGREHFEAKKASSCGLWVSADGLIIWAEAVIVSEFIHLCEVRFIETHQKIKTHEIFLLPETDYKGEE
jgi:hypothetical protein